jgi:orotate phosphoribosyltransferase-like protein
MGRPFSVVTPDLLRRMASLRESGLNKARIARRLRVNRTAVDYHLRPSKGMTYALNMETT